ncbi:protein TIC 22-like, chloroplastic [Salvia miltiorrhiza]|uniref:protein TIC 22-like, chloroplastic n=1 Tax=Salvia miltiorrhiza TaxID=226208 RepID=UPI0025AC5FE8|nr:protein TIC 22-like, chloroplastic [Salvia miltiorrhiza]
MNFFKPKDTRQPAAPPPSPQLLLHRAVTSLQTHFSTILNNLQTNPPLRNPFFARISDENNTVQSKVSPTNSSSNLTAKNCAMSPEAIEERLAGVPVYALSNGAEEFVLVSGAQSRRDLGLFFFTEADAEALLKHMKSVDSSMSSGSQVVPVALSKVFDLKVNGVALRLLPEASQIKNALQERKRVGLEDESFRGVPVFQSKSLVLRSQNKTYRPVFFRKEDLEKSLSRASRDQKQANPSLRRGDVQVAVLEDIIRGMKDTAESSWDDVVFIPPGFEVSSSPSRQH